MGSLLVRRVPAADRGNFLILAMLVVGLEPIGPLRAEFFFLRVRHGCLILPESMGAVQITVEAVSAIFRLCATSCQTYNTVAQRRGPRGSVSRPRVTIKRAGNFFVYNTNRPR